MSETNVIDRTALDRLNAILGNDPEIFSETIDEFFNDAPQFIATLHSALAQGKTDELRTAAHSFKSNSATFGATALADQCRALEMQAKAGTLEGAAERIAEIEKEYAVAAAELESIRTGG